MNIKIKSLFAMLMQPMAIRTPEQRRLAIAPSLRERYAYAGVRRADSYWPSWGMTQMLMIELRSDRQPPPRVHRARVNPSAIGEFAPVAAAGALVLAAVYLLAQLVFGITNATGWYL